MASSSCLPIRGRSKNPVTRATPLSPICDTIGDNITCEPHGPVFVIIIALPFFAIVLVGSEKEKKRFCVHKPSWPTKDQGSIFASLPQTITHRADTADLRCGKTKIVNEFVSIKVKEGSVDYLVKLN
jgi:hypothetical protein